MPGVPPVDDSKSADVTPAATTVQPDSHSAHVMGGGVLNAANKQSSASAAPAPMTPDETPKPADPVAAPMPIMPTMSDTMPANNTPAPKSRKKMMLLSVLVAVFVLMLGGAAAAYYYVMNKPENVLKMALSNALSDKVKTVHFSGAVDVKDDKSNQSFGATFTGAAAESGAIDLSAKVDAYVTNLTFDLRSVDGKSIYIRLGGLNGLPELLGATGSPEAEAYSPLIATVNNQWFEINESLIKQFTGSKDTKLSDADMQKLKDAYEKHSFLVVKESLANEKIKGANCYHYKVVIGKEELKGFVGAIKDANISGLKLTKEQVDEFNKSLKDVNFDKYPVDVWISKSDKLLRQISFDVSEAGATGKIRYTVDSYNQPVNVEKPEGAKSILDVLGSFYGAYNGGSLEDDGSEAIDAGISL
jgi:hypothetical protein